MNSLKKVMIIVFRKEPQLQFLILKTSSMRSKQMWQGVTGGIEDFDKDIYSAAVRELQEELHINATKEKLIGPLHKFTFKTNRKGYEGTIATEYCFGFEVNNDYQVILSNEHERYLWLSYEEALKRIDYDEPKFVIKKIKESIE